MSMHLYNPADADLTVLSDRAVAIIGYGNQGHAHALNLRDSGVDVIVAQRRDSPNYDRAVADGFAPTSVREAAGAADLLILTLPDEKTAEIYANEIAPVLRPGRALGFVHGFNIRFGYIAPPVDVDCVMVAPKGPGALLRSLYLQDRGLPALLAVERDATGQALKIALAWAKGIGSTRAAVGRTTFATETEADLFGEQVVLCGGVTALMKAAYETLTEAGLEPEVAYLECVHELKQVVDLVYRHGVSGMRRRVSNTAEYGDLTRGPRLVNETVRTEMRRILDEIRNGAFAEEWMAEQRAGMKNLQRLEREDAEGDMEQAGRAVRRMMPWLEDA